MSGLPKIVFSIRRTGTSAAELQTWVEQTLWPAIQAELPAEWTAVRLKAKVYPTGQNTYDIYPKVTDTGDLTDWPTLRGRVKAAVQQAFQDLGRVSLLGIHEHDE